MCKKQKNSKKIVRSMNICMNVYYSTLTHKHEDSERVNMLFFACKTAKN